MSRFNCSSDLCWRKPGFFPALPGTGSCRGISSMLLIRTPIQRFLFFNILAKPILLSFISSSTSGTSRQHGEKCTQSRRIDLRISV